MLIKTVELKRFCQHVDRTVELGPGMNAIIGPNGCGKSNFGKAIYTALTNDFSVNEGPKALNITEGTRPRQLSSVRVVAEHNGESINVRRCLQGGTTTAFFGSDDPMGGEAEITHQIMSRLGTTVVALRNFVFVQQGEIEATIKQSKTDRLKAFGRLFNLEEMEKMHGFLDARLVTEPVRDFSTQVESSRLQIDQFTQRVADARARKVLHAHHAEYDRTTDPDARRRMEHELATCNKGLIEEAGRQLGAAKDGWEVGELCRIEQGRKAAQARSVWEIYEPEVEGVRQSLADHAAFESQMAVRKRDEAMLAAAEVEAKSDIEPVRPDRHQTKEKCQELRELRDTHIADLAKVEALLAIDSDDPICPTCGASGVLLLELLEDAKSSKSSLERLIDSADTCLSISEKYDRDLTAWSSRDIHRRCKIEDLRRRLAATPVQAQVDVDPTELTEFLREATAAKTARDAAQKQLYEAVDLANQAGSKLASAQARYESLGSVNSQALLTNEELTSLDIVLHERSAGKSAYDAAYGALQSAEASLAAARTACLELAAEVAKYEVAQGWRQVVSTAKGIFHRDGLPKMVTDFYLQQVVENVSTVLEEFDAEFRIVMDEDSSGFIAKFPHKMQLATRLSGGQKITLGLALHVAVNAAFASGVGVVYLDEPTQFLDTRSLANLGKAFAILRRAAVSRNLQVIVVTHESRILDNFDKIVDFG